VPAPTSRRAALDGSQLGRGKLAVSGLDGRHQVAIEAESPDAWVTYTERVLGPILKAKAALEPEGRWEALRADLVDLYERSNQASDGSLRAEAEYLRTVGRMPV